MAYESWGRYPKSSPSIVSHLYWRGDKLPSLSKETFLPYGNGRSYGDCCLNSGARLLVTRYLDHIVNFCRASGRITVEAGLTIGELLAVTLPYGWFIPVTPGTQFVTLGGAVANDVHGKNHHSAGTLGRSILSLTLHRTDRGLVRCSPNENSELFSATVGGLGLTGVIIDITIQLKKVESPYIALEELPFYGLDEFYNLTKESESPFEHVIAWVDCLRSTGLRGIFIRGNHATSVDIQRLKGKDLAKWNSPRRLSIPFSFPSWVLSSKSIKLFNLLYYHLHSYHRGQRLQTIGPFFYPLDAISKWNMMYGKAGFFQFQCVIPASERRGATLEIFTTIRKAGEGSFLAVLKEFGALSSPGLISFPMAGTTLALDLPNRGESTLKLLSRLESITKSVGGRLYPAKDATMSGDSFRSMYPRWQELEKIRDSAISSSFWRRVTTEL